ncbi:MAG: hypothetical protein A2140_07930 [Candidatus Muproteobacteria bacterium RBG_16_62_13]|uniref:Uncharacterized protein n=1 Tax=Candidatus Muproteobacteria bacterium RBG_16_62_13 TaxID=1817756 RepID=A0A1F6T1I7_9PROT|nr:MAG: hypothetical protein A2140_07930 [Candidatus Muproteobacteria bacterium RBG_16_62_13]
MSTTILHPFAQAAERDAALFNVAQIAASNARWWLAWVLLVVMLPFILVLAQTVPFVFRPHLAILFPLLPRVTSRVELAWAKDILTLYCETLKIYKPFCLFRRQTNELIDEIEEHLDSLEFVAANEQFLQGAVAKIEQR